MRLHVLLPLLLCIIIAGEFVVVPIIKRHNRNSALSASVLDSYKPSSTQRELAEAYAPATIELMLTERVEFTVVEQAETSATLNITAPNMRELLEGIADRNTVQDNPEDEIKRIEALIKTALQNGDYSTVSNTVVVQTQEINGSMEVVPSEEYVDAIYGGMLSYYNDINAEGRVVN